MSTSALVFSVFAAAAVWFIGRRDTARDPRLTVLALGLLAGFPLISLLPEIRVLPASTATSGTSTFRQWLPWVWGAGVLFASTRLMLALSRLHVWRKRSQVIARDGIGGKTVEIRTLGEISSPVAAGIFRPVVFVPDTWHAWSDETRHAVLAHECKHHQRRDPLWRAVAAVTCTLYWFNPLVWWMARRLAGQCEFACDEAVIADGMPPDRYANVLCDLAAPVRSPATALALAHEGGLEARVRRMFSPHRQFSKVTLAAITMLTALMAIAVASLTQADPPEAPSVPIQEIRERLTADPFPGN